MKRFDVFTLVPEAFDWFIEQHPVSTAIGSGAASISVHNIRDHSWLPHHEVDDSPYGGGPGMVTRVDVVGYALEEVFGMPARRVREGREVFVLAAGGRPFDHRLALELSNSGRDLVLLCGRFEGFDARVEALFASGSISVGPYVLAGGEVAALAVLEAVIRHLPGSLGNQDSVVEESFSEGLEGMVEYPHYTRPREYEGVEVPPVLISGDHGAIARWRRANARRSPWERPVEAPGPTGGVAAGDGGKDVH
ncbi:MAG: tRNA (guanosine(37)-N1)-methyltransferase TrmD [Actinobacteria bacterium RBG_16_64_13]|nr:MAG: tRNA (guanosine(37)-N1)-methyltransferase TrmD [Actinobacteria bacterium RBG_16_64_13]